MKRLRNFVKKKVLWNKYCSLYTAKTNRNVIVQPCFVVEFCTTVTLATKVEVLLIHEIKYEQFMKLLQKHACLIVWCFETVFQENKITHRFHANKANYRSERMFSVLHFGLAFWIFLKFFLRWCRQVPFSLNILLSLGFLSFETKKKIDLRVYLVGFFVLFGKCYHSHCDLLQILPFSAKYIANRT